MKRLVIVSISIILLSVVGFVWRLETEIRGERRGAEEAVSRTVVNIRKIQAGSSWGGQAISNAAVGNVRINMLTTDPFHFIVTSMTSWPDLMVYEYDSKTPERGIYHDSF